MIKKWWRTILSDEVNEIYTEDNDTTDLQRKNIEYFRKLNCSENVDKKALQQWIKDDWELECYEVLSDNDTVPHVACDSVEAKNFEKCPEWAVS